MKWAAILLFLLSFLLAWISERAAAGRQRSARVERLLADLTLEEKVGQMTQLNIDMIIDSEDVTRVDPDKVRMYARDYHIGSFLNSPTSNNGPALNATEWVAIITTIQEIFEEEGVLPVVYGIDSVHGANYIHHATLFPQQLSAAASFNRELTEQMGAITAKDTRAVGIPWTFAPILDLATQPRFPRIYESFGEDPYVHRQLGEAMVKGYQGYPPDLSNQTRVAACMKHFLGYQSARSGHDRTTSWIPDRELLEYFIPPFQAAVDAGVATAMESYNDINGEPVCASKKYLQTILREQMGFEGMLVTDWHEILDLHVFHRVAESSKDATRITMERTSVDMSMVPSDTSFYDDLLALVNEGTIDEARLDESVARILTLKEDLGLFENPYPDPDSPLLDTIGSDEDREVARDIARESVTLLKNGKQILPLNFEQHRRILVTGPGADSLRYQSGGWTIAWQGAPDESMFPFGTTILEGLQALANESPLDPEIVYVRGCDVNGESLAGELDEVRDEAANSDVAIVVLAEDTYAERMGNIDDSMLTEGQLNLFNEVAALTNTVVVLLEGRARCLGDALPRDANAILLGYLPGPEGGQAIAEVLFGVVNPSGRLPISYPRNTGGTPIEYWHRISENHADFLYEFGHGLSYSSFSYSNLQLSSTTIQPNESLSISVDVTNDGPYDGKETVLLYIQDIYREVTPESKMLKRFEKIHLAVDETARVTFTISVDDLSFYGIDLVRIYEPGEFIIQVESLRERFDLVDD